MVLGLAVQTFCMAILASTLFIRPIMHRNNVGDASLYAAIPFYALVHMLFDGCVVPLPLFSPCSRRQTLTATVSWGQGKLEKTVSVAARNSSWLEM